MQVVTLLLLICIFLTEIWPQPKRISTSAASTGLYVAFVYFVEPIYCYFKCPKRNFYHINWMHVQPTTEPFVNADIEYELFYEVDHDGGELSDEDEDEDEDGDEMQTEGNELLLGMADMTDDKKDLIIQFEQCLNGLKHIESNTTDIQATDSQILATISEIKATIKRLESKVSTVNEEEGVEGELTANNFTILGETQ